MKIWKLFAFGVFFLLYKMVTVHNAGGEDRGYALVYLVLSFFMTIPMCIAFLISADIEEGTHARRIGIGIAVVGFLYRFGGAIITFILVGAYLVFTAYFP